MKPDRRNFGWGSRHLGKAGKYALRQRGGSYSTVATQAARFQLFADWLKDDKGIRDLRWVDKGHVVAYGGHLAAQVAAGTLALPTAVNRLSAVNVVMAAVRGDRALQVSPAAMLGKRRWVAAVDRSCDEATYLAVLSRVPPEEARVGTLIRLQYLFGLRYEESAKIDARRALEEAREHRLIAVTEGTKGGRSREVPVWQDAQFAALEEAAEVQGRHWSLIPSDLSYAAFRRRCYRVIPVIGVEGFHVFRRAYAARRYWQVTEVEPPVRLSLSRRDHLIHLQQELGLEAEQARDLDRHARSTTAEELGHGRPQITRQYYG